MFDLTGQNQGNCVRLGQILNRRHKSKMNISKNKSFRKLKTPALEPVPKNLFLKLVFLSFRLLVQNRCSQFTAGSSESQLIPRFVL